MHGERPTSRQQVRVIDVVVPVVGLAACLYSTVTFATVLDVDAATIAFPLATAFMAGVFSIFLLAVVVARRRVPSTSPTPGGATRRGGVGTFWDRLERLAEARSHTINLVGLVIVPICTAAAGAAVAVWIVADAGGP